MIEYKDRRGNLMSLSSLCRLEPEWAVAEVERLRARVAELEYCAGLEDCAQQHAVDRARIAELKARLALAERVIGELLGVAEIALAADEGATWQDAEGDSLRSVFQRLRAAWDAGGGGET